jgi:transposase
MWVVSSDSGIPLFMRTGDGNESDKAVRSFYFK